MYKSLYAYNNNFLKYEKCVENKDTLLVKIKIVKMVALSCLA